MFFPSNIASPASPNPKLSGRHILIVEDEMLIAFCLIDIIKGFGSTYVTASRVAKALSSAATQVFDAAILDMNLAGESGYPVAGALNLRGIPFIITTGRGTECIPQSCRKRPMLPKPYLPEQVVAAFSSLFAIEGENLRNERFE